MGYSINLNNKQVEKLNKFLEDYLVPSTNDYTLFRAKYKSATITLYKTNTLLLQGSNIRDEYLEVCKVIGINPSIEEETKDEDLSKSINLAIIGTDEVGTGDFFGPVVVAGVFIEKANLPKVMKLGVKDSKDLSDDKIKKLARDLRKHVVFQITMLDNLKYNYLTKINKFNLNKIKALLHNDVIIKLVSKVKKYDSIIIDGFTTKEKYLEYISDQNTRVESVELIEKAESKFLSVACASIFARAAFLSQIDKLSKEIGFELPKGASNKVDLAIQKIIKENDEIILNKIGKLNFKNYEKAKKQS